MRVRAARKCILEVREKNKFHVSLSCECFVFLLQFVARTHSGRGNMIERGMKCEYSFTLNPRIPNIKRLRNDFLWNVLREE